MFTAWIEQWLTLKSDDERYKDYSFLIMALLVLVLTNAYFLYYNIFVVPNTFMRHTMSVATLSCLVSLWLMKGRRAPTAAALIMQLDITFSSFFLVLAAGHHEFALAFMFLTPVVSMFILGYKRGAWFSLATFIGTAAFTLSTMDTWGAARFEPISFIHFTAVYLFLFIVGFFYDSSRRQTLAALRESNQKLQALATQDPLTGLVNRRYLDDYLLDSKTIRWIAIIDVDDFKQVNDVFGHHVGDSVLSTVARCLEHVAHSGDVVGRWGGEEFLFSINEMDAFKAQKKVADLLRQVSAHDFGIGRPVTVSIGLALHQPGQHRSALLLADEALYRAKASGKNQFCLANDKFDYAI
ncbi:GGDEF domain-containing protein [Photobacterium atrarenae]|uniref:diguanylate cyclase n=1 Tax=Photobacterium atrarenae TaxID=865757 RepID=A0ABY5GKL6_9GAMM|nr:GGDEF domain-containing protein [Photobacterium atrarenae]UTV29669.1 GGDEF domain-containing protein [Photobacterium atrarenae]